MLRRTFVVAGALLLLFGSAATGADGPALLTGYTLTSWTQKDGLSTALIWAVEQDRLGYLWLGTDAGALRFDGVRFVPWHSLGNIPVPSVSVRSICVSRDGTVWFGLGEPGGILALQNGVVRAYGVSDGVPEGVVMSIAEADDGTLWAGARFGVARFDGTAWHREDAGLPAGAVNAVLPERDGLVVGTAAGVFKRVAGEALFNRLGGFADNARAVARDRDGHLWVADPILGLRRVDQVEAQPATRLRGRGTSLTRDGRGNLWVGTGGQGLFRVGAADGAATRPRLERTSTATGLSDDGVTDVEEDREGNLWVATRDGLNRLTPHKLTPITDIGIANAVEASSDGRVWVGTVDDIVSFTDGRPTLRSTPIPLAHPPLAAMHADALGRVWVATATSLQQVDGARLRQVPLLGATVTEITDITGDGRGGLWLHDSRLGVVHWHDGRLTPSPLPAELQRIPLQASYTDPDGRAWFAFEGTRVAVVDRASEVRVFGKADGLAGSFRAIHQDRSGSLWFGGDGGLTRYADGRFTTLRVSSETAIRRVTGIVDDDDGALWLAIDAAGLLRLPRDEIARALADPSYDVHFSAYDKVDGSAGTSRWFGSRTAARSADGQLWFVAGRGVTVVDPAAVGEARALDAPVRIEGAIADGQALSASGPHVLPPGTARVQIDYTVLDLTSPQKRRFRHRLEGFDRDWVDAGTSHSASYTNLPPRAYTFRVMATREDGTFSTVESRWAFTIRPAFYQTWSFVAALLVAATILIGAAWRLHVLRMRRQFSMLVGERARLSREVHDTLLQSMFGYALQFDALAQSVPPSDAQLRSRLGQLRHQVEDDIREARQSIWNLRSPRLEQQDLVTSLREAVELAAGSRNVRLTFDVTGTPRRATSHVEEQVLRIGREAVSNALRHARASRVTVTLGFAASDITLTVDDDGPGFDVEQCSPANDHFGLTTMRERAESAGGSFRIHSAPGRGTTVTASLPTT